MSCYLKSSMDRFIVSYLHSKTNENFYLKSSMDRFIDDYAHKIYVTARI